MKARILVRTPKGQAEGTERKLKTLILGHSALTRGFKYTTGMNEEGDGFYWEIEARPKTIINIHRNVTLYSSSINLILSKARTKMSKKMTEEELEELDSLIEQGTEITIIKEATAQELQEDNKTYWQRIKEKFNH